MKLKMFNTWSYKTTSYR